MVAPVVIKERRHRSTSLSSMSLPPSWGKIGSILFFTILFVLAKKNSEGYEEFRKCHGNCINGLLHFVSMPAAVSGVFFIVRGVSTSPTFTRLLQSAVTTCYLYFYLTYETNTSSPWLFYGLYMTLWECLYHFFYHKACTRVQFVWYGAILILVNVGGLETIGHGIFERHHRYVKKTNILLHALIVLMSLDQPFHIFFVQHLATCWNFLTVSFIHLFMVSIAFWQPWACTETTLVGDIVIL
jgi:hypothetical protein